MYDTKTNKIYFPHIIPTPILNGEEHHWNCVDGGTTKIADLNLRQNSFYGGNVKILGFIKKYGFYGCLSERRQRLIGFYIHDPASVTKEGRKAIIGAFPKHEIVFSFYQKPAPTEQEILDAQKMKQYYLEHGMAPEIVKHASAEELKDMCDVLKAGKAEQSLFAGEEKHSRQYQEEPAVVTTHVAQKKGAK
jgi:hypothetical protein